MQPIYRREILKAGAAEKGNKRFNRPKAISCLATETLRDSGGRPSPGFNRPKASSCLATLVA